MPKLTFFFIELVHSEHSHKGQDNILYSIRLFIPIYLSKCNYTNDRYDCNDDDKDAKYQNYYRWYYAFNIYCFLKNQDFIQKSSIT